MGMWKTKGGTEIPIADMDDGHLLNAHRMMCRKLYEICKTLDAGILVPKTSMEDFDAKMFAMMGIAGFLKLEIDKRGLDSLADLPEHRYLAFLSKQAEYEVSRSAYIAYCEERGEPTYDTPALVHVWGGG